MYRRYFKRLLDIFFSIVILLFSLPLFSIVCPIQFIANRGKIFFIQKRTGLKGVTLSLIKLKTMNNACDKDGKLLPGVERTTKSGELIRSFSIDEVPQLLNVIKGDMSLVGPRPLLPEYLPLYNYHQARRHDVRPGITGWAQVNGRNNLSWEEKFDLDVWYVDNLSFGLDMKILFLTILKVIRREGINSHNPKQYGKFTGTLSCEKLVSH